MIAARHDLGLRSTEAPKRHTWDAGGRLGLGRRRRWHNCTEAGQTWQSVLCPAVAAAISKGSYVELADQRHRRAQQKRGNERMRTSGVVVDKHVPSAARPKIREAVGGALSHLVRQVSYSWAKMASINTPGTGLYQSLTL